MQDTEFRYKAFISYSHRDSQWAQWLLHALETYRLPDSTARGVGKIFRDRDEAAASDLKDEIARALTESEHLIVIASPNAARSTYVDAEIQAFAEGNARRKTPGRILTLIVDGEPNAGSAEAALECFPPALRGGALKPDGTPYEPLAADARNVGDGRTRALAKLVAGLMDIRYDTLVRRDLTRRRRTRVLAGVAAIGMVAVAGIVAAVILAGNLEQERLRVAGESAARETRTVTAVNDAERARRLLESGNRSDAVSLARQSLPLDGSVPFVPQAYDVMYRSVYARTQEVGADLANYHATAPVVLPAGNGHVFVYNDTGTVAIWSPARGVVYRRADLDWSTRPSASPDGSAIFVSGPMSMKRLNLPERSWDEADLSAAFPDLGTPAHIAAIDRQSLYACRDTRLLKIAIDAELRGAVEWALDLPAPCSAMTLAPDGGVVVGLSSFAVAINRDGEVARTYGPAGDAIVQRVYATADRVVLSHVGGTYVYHGESNEPRVIEGRSMDYFAYSPEGRWFVYTNADNQRLVVNDLIDGSTRYVPCICAFVGYYRDGQILAVSDRTIEAYDLATLASTGAVHIFEAPATTYAYLPDGNLLMGLRQSGPESIAFLDARASPTLMMDGTTDLRNSLFSANFSGTASVALRQYSSDGPQITLMPIAAREDGASAPVVIAGTGRLAHPVRLAGNRLAVVDPDPDTVGAIIRIHDGDSGEMLWAGDTLIDPNLQPGARYVGIEDDLGLSIYDAEAGALVELPEPGYFNWTLAGDRLLGAYAGETSFELELLRLNDGTPEHLWMQPLESGPYYLCVAPGGPLYVVRNADEALQFEQRSNETGELLARFESRETTMLDANGMIAAAVDVSCDASSLRLPGLRSQQWRWDVKRGELAAEPLAGTPPRGNDEPTGIADLPSIATAKVGADDLRSWLYDPATDSVLVEVPTEGGRVSSSLYLPASGQIVLGFESGRLEVWDAQRASAPMIALERHTSPIVSLDHDAARQLLLSADKEGTIHLWPLPAPDVLTAQASDG